MHMNKTGLMIIDIQNIYFEDGDFKLYHPEETSIKARKVLDYFRSNKLPVIHVQHMFKVNDVSESEKFRLCEIHKNVMPIEGETIVVKNFPNSFLKTNLQTCLEKLEISNLIVVGMMSHMCIDTTVRESQNFGYNVIVLEDACTTKNLKTLNGEIPASTVHDVFMAALKGTFAQIMTVDEYIDAN